MSGVCSTQRQLQRLDGIVPAIRVAGKIGLADAGHDMLDAPPIGGDRRHGQKQQVSPRHEGIGQAVRLHGDFGLSRQRCLAEFSDDPGIDDMIRAELRRPVRELGAQRAENRRADVQFHPVALAIVEADRLDAREAVKRPGQAGRRILPARKQHQSLAIRRRHAAPFSRIT
jgi:hypothetical protein